MSTNLRFWLRVVESRGGLAETSGDTTLVMLPPDLQTLFDLPAEIEVTDDPDVAREDGVAFLGAGHPAIAKAADTLLAGADVGVIQLAPSLRMPDLGDLEQKARGRFPVAHGRIDLDEPPQRGTLDVIRLGALVRYTLSDEDHYQEELEQLIDAETRLPISAPVAARLMSAHRSPVDRAVEQPDVIEALLSAYRGIDAVATRRRMDLAKDVAGAYRDEVARTEAYYAAALESVAKRRANAPAERQALLDARADATRAERTRRLDEIAEKYRGTHEIEPFRLHLQRVPVLRLEAQVRRGDRRYALRLTWLEAAADFVGVRCPACGRHAPLDAGKTQLGCIACQTKAPVIPPPRPPSPPAPAAAGKGSTSTGAGPPAKAPTSTAGPGRRERAAPAAGATTSSTGAAAHSTGPISRGGPARVKELTGKQLSDAGAKLSLALWRAAAEDDNRAMKRLIAPQSPMSTAFRLFRSLAPTVSVGVPAAAMLDQITSQSYPHQVADHYVTAGEVTASAHAYPYSLVWRDHPGQREVVQITPTMPGFFNRHLDAIALRRRSGDRLFDKCPRPVEPLDSVAAAVWQTTRPLLGLPTALRALTSWWRLADAEALLERFPAEVIGAALERAACYWGGGGPGGYDAAAQAYGVSVDEVRKVGPLLQKALKLTAEQPW